MIADYNFVKVFGERNTGTRALIKMLSSQSGVFMRPQNTAPATNLPANAELRARIDASYKGAWRRLYRDALRDNEQAAACPTMAWKHAAPVWDPAYKAKDARVVFCMRNPYSWALSLFKRPYHQKGPRSRTALDFVSKPWLTIGRDNLAPVLSSPLDLWNEKLGAYGDFRRVAEVPTEVVLFERFVASPRSEVSRVLSAFQIHHEEVENLKQSTKNTKAALGDISDYYSNEKWKKELDAELVEAINVRVNWDLAAQFGYYKSDPGGFTRKSTLKSWFRSRSLMSRSGSRL